MNGFRLLLVLTFFFLGALSAEAQIQTGITVGVDYTTMNIRNEFFRNYGEIKGVNTDLGIKGVPGWHFGINTKFKIKENLHLSADLLLSKKGFKQEFTPRNYSSDESNDFDVSLYYIDVPVLMEFKAKFDKVNILFGIGPYISYGITGEVNLKMNYQTGIVEYSEKIRWGKKAHSSDFNKEGEAVIDLFGYSSIKRIDYGSAIRFGAEFKSFIWSIEYKHGLKNVKWEFTEHEHIRNQTLGLSLTYKLK